MDTPSDNAPRKRAGNADRERIAQFLYDAHLDGQLTLTEFDERTKQLWAAVYKDELAELTADLSPVSPGHDVAPYGGRDVARRPGGVPAQRGYVPEGGSAMSFSVMGGVERAGDWHIAPNHTSITVMGGNELDLRHAQFSAHETVINAFAIMGGIDIIVPEGVRVIDEGIGLMGGFGFAAGPAGPAGTAGGRDAAAAPDPLPADAPVIRVRGIALMGGVEIKRG